MLLKRITEYQCLTFLLKVIKSTYEEPILYDHHPH